MARPGHALRIAVVGPTHPLKGGVAAHTTELARHLTRAGHDVELVSWSRLYPGLLYPGEAAVPDGLPDLAPFPATTRPLSWARPDSWWRTGRRLRDHDLVVVVHVVPAVAPAHLTLLRAAGAGVPGGPRALVVAHNVLPHEPHAGAAALVESLLARADGVLVHTEDQATLAREHGASHVAVAPLPPHLPGGPPVERPAYDGPARLLSLGIVRDYKGVDLLIEALREVDGPTLTVAGELWGEAGERVRRLAADPALAGRVRLREGYVPGPQVPALLAAHDVLALPYRTATASQNVLLARRHGLAVLATRVGTFADDVRDGVDGLLVAPGETGALVGALHRLTEPGALPKLLGAVREPDLDGPWARYTGVLESLARNGSEGSDDAEGQVAAPPGGRAIALAKRAAEHALWARVGVQRRVEERLPAQVAERLPQVRGWEVGRPRPVPDGVRPTAVLRSRAEWEEAVADARRLGLPLHRDRPKNWDALGAVGAVLRLADDGSRSARVMDAGSARYSPVLPWLRLYGLGGEPESLLGINLEFGEPVVRDGVTFRYGDVTSTGLADGELDAITCMSVIEHGVPIRPFLAESARVLRPGGILTLSTDYDRHPPDTSGMQAYGGPVRIFSPSDLRALVADAHAVGLDLVGDIDVPGALDHEERPVRWARLGLDYTFVLLTFRRR